MTEPLPTDVARLIARHVHSPAQLEALLTLYGKADAWWTASSLGKELGVPAWAARERLEDLASRGFLDVKTADDVAFRFSPSTPGAAEDVASLARVYYQRPAAILAHVRSSAVRAFADAFRLKREDDTDG